MSRVPSLPLFRLCRKARSLQYSLMSSFNQFEPRILPSRKIRALKHQIAQLKHQNKVDRTLFTIGLVIAVFLVLDFTILIGYSSEVKGLYGVFPNALLL